MWLSTPVGDGGDSVDLRIAEMIVVRVNPDAPSGLVAGGTVHHLAWRAPDEATQQHWRAELAERGAQVTSILDRQ